ncbi:putative mitochondrial protein, partial [Mucuna pruriens]
MSLLIIGVKPFLLEADHSVFYCHSSSVKAALIQPLPNQRSRPPKYFLGIEVVQFKENIVISQRKYALDILQETSMSNCRLVDSPMDPNMKLMVKHGEPYFDPERYRTLVGKFIYLTVTRPDISFAVEVVCQYLALITGQQSSVSLDMSRRHLDRTPIYQVIVVLIGQDLPLIDDLLQVFAYLLGGNVASWKSKKQNIVARSEVEYRAMAPATCELIWVNNLFKN